jgi:uncharacterized protein (TIGR03545 family)
MSDPLRDLKPVWKASAAEESPPGAHSALPSSPLQGEGVANLNDEAPSSCVAGTIASVHSRTSQAIALGKSGAKLAVGVTKTGVRAPKKALSIFRWQYFVPRLVGVGAIYAAFYFGLDPALRYSIIAGGQAALGAKVEVGELTTSLRDGQIVVTNFAAANSRKPMRNLLDAEEVRFRLDPNLLLRKRLVVKDGSISGLRFDSPRTTSGALELPATSEEEQGPSVFDPAMAAAGEKAAEWYRDLSGRVEADMMSVLASPRLAKELEERWPKEYAELKSRADELKAKGKQVENTFRELKKNPLRNLAKIEELQAQLKAVETKTHNVMGEIARLPQQAKADKAAIDAARKQDMEYVKQNLKAGALDGAELTRYLLGDEASSSLAETVAWIQWIQQMIPKSKIKSPSRMTGTNVLFVRQRLPKMLLERVQVDGTASVDGQALSFAGQITDVTTEPMLHDQPTRIELTGSGAVGYSLLAIIDRRGAVSHDSLTIDCPKLQLAHRTLGKADKLAVKVTPGDASLHAEVRIDGDELSGFIAFKQSSTLEADTPLLRDDRIAAMLKESMAEVDRIEAKVVLSGTLRRPACNVESNLGPQLAAGINGAVAKYLTHRRERIQAEVQEKVDQQMAKLDEARQKAEAELTKALGENQQLIAQLQGVMNGSGSLPGVAQGLAAPQISKAFEKLQR